MDFIKTAFDFVMHLDTSLGSIIDSYGTATYIILFAVIFCETGLVVTPFLPGDSLIFAAGTFCAIDAMDLPLLMILLMVAAVGGDTLNYWIGKQLRHLLKDSKKLTFIKREHLDQTSAFFDRHGGKTIVLARFVPIIRTFAPFVAGAGRMDYRYFITYNIIGGVSWVALFSLTGYFFGNLPFIKDNFSLVIIAVVLVSFIPVAVQFIKSASKKKDVKNTDQEQDPVGCSVGTEEK